MYTQLRARDTSIRRLLARVGPVNTSRSSTTDGKVVVLRRRYHDESFGFRRARDFTMSDYTPKQLANRVTNAPLLRYADALRTHGHRAASIDPLDLLQRERVAALEPARYGLTDPSAQYNVDGILWTGEDHANGQNWSLDDITGFLNAVYVGRIAYEYMDLPSKTERLWFANLLESESASVVHAVSPDRQRRTHALLASSEVLDAFLQTKFPNLKRYGLEGGESMLPALDALFAVAAQADMTHIILAMPHRGRLNLLTGLLEYDPAALFHKIKGRTGTASPTLNYGGKEIKVSLLPNPSHLEAVNPVALGKARAKQYSLLKALEKGGSGAEGCMLGDKVMCVQLHGDASFTGQGVIMETLGLSNLPHYTSGGSVHIVVDIGYTTPASAARSSLYCSDVAKMVNCPVLHVNGDYPEDVSRAIEIAFKYRSHFRKDIVIDLMVYRRWQVSSFNDSTVISRSKSTCRGHNELDEPAYTQPIMYQKIRSRQSVPQLYEDKLVWKSAVINGRKVPMVWPGSNEAKTFDTGAPVEMLQTAGKGSVEVPTGFEIHPRLQRHVKSRLASLDKGEGVDWATAEAMAFGTLMLDGCDVRIAGQDVGRGTFSQRHAMLVDQNTEGVIVPLNHALTEAVGKLELANSGSFRLIVALLTERIYSGSLSELAVLGFEYGTSWERSDLLPIWEAQFGDFFNGAQIIVDAFISSAEMDETERDCAPAAPLVWTEPVQSTPPVASRGCYSSQTIPILPASNVNINMHVVFPTTPAQYFHLLRRQIKRNYRKPLVVAAPKGLLRLAAASSELSEMLPGTQFHPVLPDAYAPTENIERVVLVSGKFYYELAKERAARGMEERVALIRIEELAPFPFSYLEEVLRPYTMLSVKPEWFWVQEEPKNQGAWGHVKDRLGAVLSGLSERAEVRFVGRREDAVPATGTGREYQVQQRAVVERPFQGL
ncbi:thiamine diphosphate-binding protein [Chiua virens]|nr:thiamine diphosphate-binding protein [Chiua virens]